MLNVHYQFNVFQVLIVLKSEQAPMANAHQSSHKLVEVL